MMPVNLISYTQSHFKRKSLVVFNITPLSTDSNCDSQDSITIIEQTQLDTNCFFDKDNRSYITLLRN
jgi:beta-xylosidase